VEDVSGVFGKFRLVQFCHIIASRHRWKENIINCELKAKFPVYRNILHFLSKIDFVYYKLYIKLRKY